MQQELPLNPPGETFQVLKEGKSTLTADTARVSWCLKPGSGWRTKPCATVLAAGQGRRTGRCTAFAGDVPPLSDYGLYRCTACGKLAVGFDKESHVRTVHGGQRVRFEKVR